MTKGQDTKVRLVKSARGGVRSGVIAVHDERGRTFYRCDCDRCNQSARLSFRPTRDREVLCDDCMRTMRRAKPSTRAARRPGRPAAYFTDCDQCDARTKTSFIPKQDRPFLCNGCMKQARVEQTRVEQNRVEQNRVDQNRVELNGEEQNGEEQNGVDQARVEQTGIDQTGMDQTRVYQVTEEIPASEALPAQPIHQSPAPEAEDKVETAAVAKPTGDVADTEQESGESPPLGSVPCGGCGRVMQLRFQPKTGERILCPNCYSKRAMKDEARRLRKAAGEQSSKKAGSRKSGTRVLFNLECARCGKRETVDFVPKRRDEALCSACFEKVTGRH